jgi:transformation/transcription domain-associated protein
VLRLWRDADSQEQSEQHVEPFLELVKQMYANTKSVVEKEFAPPQPKSAVRTMPG